MAPTSHRETLQYVRDGECDEIFTTRVGTGELIFEGSKFLQPGGLIPISDLHEVLYSYASFLCTRNQEPRGKFAIGVDRAAVEALMVSSVLVRDPTPELIADSQPDQTLLAWAVKNNLQAHGVAEKILEHVITLPRFSMGMYMKILCLSLIHISEPTRPY